MRILPLNYDSYLSSSILFPKPHKRIKLIRLSFWIHHSFPSSIKYQITLLNFFLQQYAPIRSNIVINLIPPNAPQGHSIQSSCVCCILILRRLIIVQPTPLSSQAINRFCRRTSPRIKRNQWCNLPFRCVGGDHLQLSPNSDQLRIDLRSGGFRIERDPEEVLDNNRQTLGISSIESIVYLYPSQDYAKTRCQQKDNLYFGHHSLAD